MTKSDLITDLPCINCMNYVRFVDSVYQPHCKIDPETPIREKIDDDGICSDYDPEKWNTKGIIPLEERLAHY